MAKIIRVDFDPKGRLANQMVHYLLARILQASVPGSEIVGCSMPEWRIEHPDRERDAAEVITLYGHIIPWRHALSRLRESDDIEIHTKSLAARLEYFGAYRDLAREIFPIRPDLQTGFDREHLVFNIRTGDIYTGMHPSYTLLPLRFYQSLLDKTGLKPVFVGELHDNDYVAAIRSRFPKATFISSERPVDDFNILRTSANVVLSTSTFSWLATWMSVAAKRIVMPVIGFYNPLDRPDVDLLPVGDRRYRFYLFPSERFRGTAAEIAEKIDGPANARLIRAPRLFRARATLDAYRAGSLPKGITLWRGISPALPGLGFGQKPAAIPRGGRRGAD
ncbi:MAG: hypothetical protein KDJ86_20000 [Bauldia sp.]|uniref:hypothetical protein n=1 Tax=Bauldia sp. TaxID=2575872 RepID=UPI001DBB390C|nr:hypothetical protein [Bauldia sp.]MCB1498078.1 hypothetical protein [Bauldia sp.]